jgi:hypothetical protein
MNTAGGVLFYDAPDNLGAGPDGTVKPSERWGFRPALLS